MARERASMSVSATAPMRAPSLERGIVVNLSTMMLLGWANPVSDGLSGIRSSGISVRSLVRGQMVIESVASKRSS